MLVVQRRGDDLAVVPVRGGVGSVGFQRPRNESLEPRKRIFLMLPRRRPEPLASELWWITSKPAKRRQPNTGAPRSDEVCDAIHSRFRFGPGLCRTDIRGYACPVSDCATREFEHQNG